jgi:hypothetical protein
MMPLAFDLISTLVMGSTLPVATTERVIVPRSTTAILDGSMAGAAPFRRANPQGPPTRTTTTAASSAHFLDFRIPTSLSPVDVESPEKLPNHVDPENDRRGEPERTFRILPACPGPSAGPRGRLHPRRSPGVPGSLPAPALADGALEVRDLESTNGTYVNGAARRSGPPVAGDKVQVGRVELVAPERRP